MRCWWWWFIRLIVYKYIEWQPRSACFSASSALLERATSTSAASPRCILHLTQQHPQKVVTPQIRSPRQSACALQWSQNALRQETHLIVFNTQSRLPSNHPNSNNMQFGIKRESLGLALAGEPSHNRQDFIVVRVVFNSVWSGQRFLWCDAFHYRVPRMFGLLLNHHDLRLLPLFCDNCRRDTILVSHLSQIFEY